LSQCVMGPVSANAATFYANSFEWPRSREDPFLDPLAIFIRYLFMQLPSQVEAYFITFLGDLGDLVVRVSRTVAVYTNGF